MCCFLLLMAVCVHLLGMQDRTSALEAIPACSCANGRMAWLSVRSCAFDMQGKQGGGVWRFRFPWAGCGVKIPLSVIYFSRTKKLL
jgi:hypothetical protein